MPRPLTTDPAAIRLTRGGATWATSDEIQFLRLLGTGWLNAPRSQRHAVLADRPTLLRRYLAAMPLRANWGAMDLGRIRREARAMLEGRPHA